MYCVAVTYIFDNPQRSVTVPYYAPNAKAAEIMKCVFRQQAHSSSSNVPPISTVSESFMLSPDLPISL